MSGIPLRLRYTINKWLARFGYQVRRTESGRGLPEIGPGPDGVLDLLFEVLVHQIHRKIHPSEFVFLQVGAYDGVTNDPLHDYVKRFGWRGILIEPQPAPFAALKKNYAGHDQLVLLNAAVGEPGKGMDFYHLPDRADLPEWSRQIASFNRDNILKHRDGMPEIGIHEKIDDIAALVETLPVRVLSFDDLIDEQALTHLDLLQIDAEGYDAQLLHSFDFNRIKPALVQFEHLHLSGGERQACYDRLRRHGYQYLSGFADTLAYQL